MSLRKFNEFFCFLSFSYCKNRSDDLQAIHMSKQKSSHEIFNLWHRKMRILSSSTWEIFRERTETEGEEEKAGCQTFHSSCSSSQGWVLQGCGLETDWDERSIDREFSAFHQRWDSGERASSGSCPAPLPATLEVHKRQERKMPACSSPGPVLVPKVCVQDSEVPKWGLKRQLIWKPIDL